MNVTDAKICSGTPYHAARQAQKDHGLDSEEFKEAALLECAFLKELLPPEEISSVRTADVEDKGA